MRVKKNSKRSGSRKYYYLLLPVLAVVILAVLELTNTTYFFHHHKSSPVIPSKSLSKSSTNHGSASSKSANASSSEQVPASPNGVQKQTATSSTTALTAPYGTFVSNHSPGKDGSPTSEQSVCNTTPAANCTIQFTKDGITKSLQTQATDSSGAAYWTWDVNDAKDIGLTSGSWSVSAIASFKGQTQTTADVIPLVVQ